MDRLRVSFAFFHLQELDVRSEESLVSWQPQNQPVKLITSMGDLTKRVPWYEGGNAQ